MSPPRLRAALPVVPLVGQLRDATPRTLRDDVVAGVLVTAVAVPLSVGFADVAGVPPVVGLYTCLLPLVGFALLGSSRHLKLGLDAASAALFAAALAPLAVTVGGDPQRYLALVALLTLLVGVITLLAGLLRLGAVGDLLSLPVLVGYQTGIALSVVVGQLPKLLGVTADGGNDVALALDVVRRVGGASAVTVALGAGSLLVLRVLRSRWPGVPAGLLVLLGGTAVSVLLGLDGHGVAVVGDLPSGLPHLGLPTATWDDVRSLLGPAAGIALVTSADVVVTSRSFAARTRDRVVPSQDLVGLGAANLLSGLSGGLSTSASYARTALSERSGSRSQVSSLAAAAAMAAVLLLLTDPLGSVPRAVLSAVVVDAVLGLVDVDAFARLWRTRRAEALLAGFTAVGVLTLGLLPTLVAAVCLAVLHFLRRLVRAEHASTTPAPGVLVFSWDAPLFFGNAGAFRARLLEQLSLAEDGAAVHRLVVDGAAISEIDASGLDELEQLARDLAARDVLLVVAEPPGNERDLLDGSAFARPDEPGLLVDDVAAALGAGPPVTPGQPPAPDR